MIRPSAKEIFNRYKNRVSKNLGQNFLFDENINRKIVSAAGDLAGKTVIEIGPGPGGLTLEILKQDIKKLHLLEYDEHWASVWEEMKPLFAGKLDVIHCDALRFNLETLSPNVVVSNLPYNISTQLLFRWLPQFDLCEKFVLMFQKEVADRLCAVPSTKAYGKLSILIQWKSALKRICDLEPGSFSPPPNVKSSVLLFSPYPKNEIECYEHFQRFSDILMDAFGHRRKILQGQLKKYFENPAEILENLGYSTNARAEQISVPDFIEICKMHLKYKI